MLKYHTVVENQGSRFLGKNAKMVAQRTPKVVKIGPKSISERTRVDCDRSRGRFWWMPKFDRFLGARFSNAREPCVYPAGGPGPNIRSGPAGARGVIESGSFLPVSIAFYLSTSSFCTSLFIYNIPI